ncbi:UNVERIFIED_CONTAM: hypothetical protein GTU68_049258 [Idotea baltica]|nr:hypothetical protein [Idotea baltica]
MMRAIHEWCTDNGLTPHLLVVVNERTRVPIAFVKDGEIVLNLNYSATQGLSIDNDAVVFSARFSGVSHQMYIPMDAVRGIYARENGQGMFFELGAQEALFSASEGDAESGASDVKSDAEVKKKRPNLTIVK